jgi:hypothetical protein
MGEMLFLVSVTYHTQMNLITQFKALGADLCMMRKSFKIWTRESKNVFKMVSIFTKKVSKDWKNDDESEQKFLLGFTDETRRNYCKS